MNPIPKETLEQLLELINDPEVLKISAKIIVKSKSSGIDHTYKIMKNNPSTVAIQQEIHANTFKPVAIGAISSELVVIIPRFRNNPSSVVKGAEWFLRNLIQNNIDTIYEKSDLFHTGSCIKCGRPLTDFESVKLGIGPVCRAFNS